MKKMLLLAALVAATTAFTGCSSDEEIAQAPNAIEESATPEEEGTPLTIKLVDATRGTDWTAATLPSFKLYSVENGGTERWLGEYENGVSKGESFTNADGVFSSESTISWKKKGNWDFYALSDASFATEEVDGEEQAAEHLDAESNRNFTYVINNDYNSQTDLLVAAAMKQNISTPEVTLPFEHALAQIGQITLKFGELTEDNSDKYWIIKSVTLHNLNSQGKYTFPDTWTASTYDSEKNKWNVATNGTWSDQTLPKSFHIELPQFELDDYGNYKIFTETVDDDDDPDPAEFESTAFAAGKRGSTNVPNYFQCPEASQTWSYVMPFAKKAGSEGDTFKEYVAGDATYTEDGGLYIIPQALPKTVWKKNSSDEITGVESGVYLEVKGIILYQNNPDDAFNESFNSEFEGATGSWGLTNVNNYYVTQLLNHDDYIGTYLIPLDKDKKELKPGKLYNLTFDLSKAVTTEGGAGVFEGAEIE